MKEIKDELDFDRNFLKEQFTWRDNQGAFRNVFRMVVTMGVYGLFFYIIVMGLVSILG